MTLKYMCPVCGYPDLDEPPRDAETGGGSYDICPSCGFEFGVTDDDYGFTYEQWRERWIAGGMRWVHIESDPPASNWDPHAQLAKVWPDLRGASTPEHP